MKKTLLVVIALLLLLAASACSASSAQAPTIQEQTDLPLTEADVPRVSVDEAKVTFDNDEAIIVDVRSAEFYAAGHATGAINIPLDQFENNIANIPLEKDQWIITYCT